MLYQRQRQFARSLGRTPMTDVTRVFNAASFALQCIEHRGHALYKVWTWPLGQQCVGMDVVLRSTTGMVPAASSITQSCQLQRLESMPQPIWILGNCSRELLCSVNSRTLSAGQQIRLDHGDVVEICLTRFKVCIRDACDFESLYKTEAISLSAENSVSTFR